MLPVAARIRCHLPYLQWFQAFLRALGFRGKAWFDAGLLSIGARVMGGYDLQLEASWGLQALSIQSIGSGHVGLGTFTHLGLSKSLARAVMNKFSARVHFQCKVLVLVLEMRILGPLPFP